MRFPVNRHRVWQLVFDAVLIVAAWRLDVLPALRPDDRRSIYPHLLDWQVVALVVGDQARDVRRLRLLQPLVALRLDARHVGRRPRRHRRLRADVPDPLRVPAEHHLAAAAPDHGARLPAAARVRRRLAPARALADRAAEGQSRRARQGGADRRRRRRGPADGARDAAQPASALHADRLRRRRSAEAGRPHQRRSRARHDGRPRASAARQPPGRGADRDPVGAGLGAPADRRELPRGERPGQDAAGAARADQRRREPRRPDPRRCRSRTCSAASRSRSTCAWSPPTSRDARCSSPAPAARSARSSAASWRGSASRG